MRRGGLFGVAEETVLDVTKMGHDEAALDIPEWTIKAVGGQTDITTREMKCSKIA
jgi:hypothetical protein